MASSTTLTRRTSAGWTSSGACISGSTARHSVATRPAYGGAATTSTRQGLARGQAVPPRAGPGVELSAQLTAFFTSSPILASSVAVNSFSAKATGHRPPSSSFAASLNPNVAYLVLNFCAVWKWQTILPSLAYAGIPYQVVGESA